MSKKKLTQTRLKELLHYTPDTGVFIWKVSRGSVAAGHPAGTVASNGYEGIRVDGRMYRGHRLAWLYVYGYFPEDSVDHINRKRADNRIANLREVSHQCNIRNSSRRSDNSSGVTGVCWDKKREEWQAYIIVSNKQTRLGNFKNKLDAVRIRWKAEVEHSFPNCCSDSSAYKYLQKKMPWFC